MTWVNISQSQLFFGRLLLTGTWYIIAAFITTLQIKFSQGSSHICYFSLPHPSSFLRLSHSAVYANWSTWHEINYCHEISCCSYRCPHKVHVLAFFFSFCTSVVMRFWICECHRDWNKFTPYLRPRSTCTTLLRCAWFPGANPGERFKTRSE